MVKGIKSNSSRIQQSSSSFFELKTNSVSLGNTVGVTKTLERPEGTLVFDDSEGTGELLILVQGAGDIRSEYRFLAPELIKAGYRIVTLDLRGHGDSSSSFSDYGVAASASDILALIEALGANSTTVVGTSFAPAAALWAAAEAPEKIKKLVLISAHLEDSSGFEKGLLNTLLRGPWKARLWATVYKSWYPSAKPADMESYLRQLRKTISAPQKAKAARQTLTASRAGLDEKLANVRLPALVIMGSKDAHFKNPEAEAQSIAKKVAGTYQLIEGAGHYPHAEMPAKVAPLILEFLGAN